LALVSSEKHAAQNPEKLRKSLFFELQISCSNQLNHAGVSPYEKALLANS